MFNVYDGGLREEGVFKLSLTSTLKRYETIFWLY